MDAGTPPPTAESAADSRTVSRRRPLRTCGASLAAIADIALTKSQDFGLFGSIVKLIAAVASARPFSSCIRAVKYLCLAALFFIDRYILAIESVVENLFPSSASVFDKIDELFRVVEVLPRELDDAINNFPAVFHQVPVLDYAAVRVISWLKHSISLLTLGSTKEKETAVDISYQQLETDPPSPPVYELHGSASDVKNEEMSPAQSDTLQAEAEARVSTAELDARESSYAGVLEKEKIENIETKDDDAMEKAVSVRAEYKYVESEEAASFLASTQSDTSQAEAEADGSTAELDDGESRYTDVVEKGMVENIKTRDDDNVEKAVSEKAEYKYAESEEAASFSASTQSEAEEDISAAELDDREISHADVVEKGMIENIETEDDNNLEKAVSEKAGNNNSEIEEAVSMKKEVVVSKEEMEEAEETQGEDAERSDEDLVLVDKDELLELFESSWHASPTRRST